MSMRSERKDRAKQKRKEIVDAIAARMSEEMGKHHDVRQAIRAVDSWLCKTIPPQEMAMYRSAVHKYTNIFAEKARELMAKKEIPCA